MKAQCLRKRTSRCSPATCTSRTSCYSRQSTSVFSHATLQWVDDHEALFAKLARALAPGGQL
ncbi:MAG TPA: methyltransferase domain-containing protein, partial [Candidatus Binatia bacterium]|nr:methyltransferase domain-containing protein [Candidatus Binatia bacterium]